MALAWVLFSLWRRVSCASPVLPALLQLIDLGLDEYVEPLSVISEAATREHRIETGLTAMQAEWRKQELVLKPYRNTGTHSLTGPSADDVKALLEEHQIRTHTMQGERRIRARRLQPLPHAGVWRRRVSCATPCVRLLRVVCRLAVCRAVPSSCGVARQVPQLHVRSGVNVDRSADVVALSWCVVRRVPRVQREAS
jgi:hypothetical protein